MDVVKEIAGHIVDMLVHADWRIGVIAAVALAVLITLLYLAAKGVPGLSAAIAAWHGRHRGEVLERTTDDAGDHIPGAGLPPMTVRPDGTIPLSQEPKDPLEP